MRALSNLVYLSDEIRLEVGRRFASIIADVLKRFHNDSTVFSMSLRVVGNLSLCDDNTPLLVQHGVLAQLVTGEYRCVVFVCDLIEWSGYSASLTCACTHTHCILVATRNGWDKCGFHVAGLVANKERATVALMSLQVLKNLLCSRASTLDDGSRVKERAVHDGACEAVQACMKFHQDNADIGSAAMEVILALTDEAAFLGLLLTESNELVRWGGFFCGMLCSVLCCKASAWRCSRAGVQVSDLSLALRSLDYDFDTA